MLIDWICCVIDEVKEVDELLSLGADRTKLPFIEMDSGVGFCTIVCKVYWMSVE